jgi:ribonucleoside-diphosphate reductase alpha chain
LNLGLFVTSGRNLDVDLLRASTRIAIRALDNVVDMVEVRVDSVHKTARDNRRLGLGIMGLADMLVRMRLGYATASGRSEAAQAMRIINEESNAESRRLCTEKGPFPNIELSIFAAPDKRRRNAATTTVAPTGTTSNIVDASGGCEPHFALAYTRKSFGDVVLTYVNADFERELRELSLPTDEEARIIAEVTRSGTLTTVPEEWGVPSWMREVYVVAGDISPDDHLLMQADLQAHTENSLSKTLNLPSTATVDDVEAIYLRAHELGCKGGTCYVDGSRTLQVLETKATTEARAEPCPDCGAALRRSEGCLTCDACSYGVCGV